MTYFDEELIEDAIIEVKVEGNTFECLLCGQNHEISEEGWEIDNDFNMPMKSYTCSKNVYYVFVKTKEGVINFMYGLDCLQLQDGELK